MPIRLRVVVASSPRSSPRSSLRPSNARKSEHCLPSTSITWMNSPGAHLVRERGRGVDPEIETGLGERRRQLVLLVPPGCGTPDLDEELRGRRRAVEDPPARSRDDDRHRAVGPERLRGPGRRPLPEEPDRVRLAGIEPARAELVDEEAPVPRRERVADHGRGCIRRLAERGRVVLPGRVEHGQLRDLAAVLVDHGDPLVRPEREHGRSARADEVRLEERVLRPEARGRGRVCPGSSPHAFAGAFVSSSAACAMSCSASSRLPSASSFFVSFSTARRLYDWFQ